MTPAIELRGLTKDFRVGVSGARLRVLEQLSLRVAPGQVFGLLGPNGSGKSTTLKILLGLIEATAGTAWIFGCNSRDVAARSRVGYLPEAPDFYPYLTGREVVAFYGRLSGLSRAALPDRVREVLAWVGLTADAERRIETYSKGMLQRIGLAQALVHRPQLLILDEPTAGVDAAGAEAMKGMIHRLKTEGATVLITSHLLGEIEEVCDRVALLEHGRLVLEGTVDELTEGADRLTLTGKELAPEDRAELESWLGARGWVVEAMRRPPSRLEQVYRQRTGRIQS
jgi:ABC-2 type transport system ATP-binding protein